MYRNGHFARTYAIAYTDEMISWEYEILHSVKIERPAGYCYLSSLLFTVCWCHCHHHYHTITRKLALSTCINVSTPTPHTIYWNLMLQRNRPTIEQIYIHTSNASADVLTTPKYTHAHKLMNECDGTRLKIIHKKKEKYSAKSTDSSWKM